METSVQFIPSIEVYGKSIFTVQCTRSCVCLYILILICISDNYSDPTDPGGFLIKRVIALAGDHVK